jgi:hypothetical protein
MRPQLCLSLLFASLLALPAWAQNAGKPLNLKLPPSDLPVSSATAAKPPASAPGVYYGDTSGHLAADDEAPPHDDCDDATYNQPQLHGSVGMGVMSGSHVDGSYQQGTVNLSQAFGSCDHPTGGISVSVGTSTGHFHDHGH